MKFVHEFPDLHKFLSFILVEISKEQVNEYNEVQDPDRKDQDFEKRSSIVLHGDSSCQNSDQGFIKTKHSEKILDYNFWFEKLKTYEVTGIAFSDDFTHYISNFIYTKSSKGTDIFSKNSTYMFSADLGIFIIHTHGKGYIKELELYFEENMFPPYMMDLMKAFPNTENPYSDKEIAREISKTGSFNMDEAIKSFAKQNLMIFDMD